jgi:phage-related protein (TIGR01555 family)
MVRPSSKYSKRPQQTRPPQGPPLNFPDVALEPPRRRGRDWPEGYTPTPEEIRAAFGPARTLAASEDMRMAADSQLDGAGVYSLIQHSLSLGMDGLGGERFLGYPFLSGLAQNGLIAACVDTVAGEMTRAWIELTRQGENADRDGNGRDDDLDLLEDETKKFDLQNIFQKAAALTGYFGGCLIFIDTGAKGADLLTPLDISEKGAELKDGGLKRFTVVEPLSVFPGQYNTIDPLSPQYFRPSTWWIQSVQVHASRLIYFAANQPPVLLRPAYNFFGIPLAQILYDYVIHFQECRLAAQRLLTKFSLTALKTDMAAVLGGGSAQNVERRVAYFVQKRSNDGCLVLDKEAEDIVKLETPLGGVTDIVKQSLELIACIAKIPAVKLLGISPSGFNATGESDLRNYYDHVATQQEKILRPGLDKALRVLQVACLGRVLPEIGFNFASLSRDDERAKAEVQKLKADTAAVYIQAGVLTAEDARETLSGDPDSGYNDLGKAPAGGAEMEAELAKIFGPAPAPALGLDAAEGERWITLTSGKRIRIDAEGNVTAGFKGFVGKNVSELGEGPAGKTSPEEKQKKIDSVKIDFTKDNTLPGLNTEDLDALGKEDKPVLLKKGIIEKNLEHHPDVSPDDYAKIIGQSLYSPEAILPANPDKPYFNFIKRVGLDKSSIVLLELAETKNNHEIVNLHWISDEGRERKERKKS